MENSSLRDALDDAQAQRLFDWGLAKLQQTAERTANLPDDDAQPLLTERAAAVAGVMRRINELVAGLKELDETAAAEELQQLVAAADRLKARSSSVAQLMECQALVNRRQELDDQALFDALMDLISTGTKDTTEEE